jgi:MATE family multidrug resistance protein
VAGVAWGTMVGETAGALPALFIVLRGFSPSLPAGMRAEIFSRHRLAELFALNRDILIRTFVLSAAFTLMTRIGTSFGAVTLAANAVLMNFFLLSAIISTGLPMPPNRSPAGRSARITGRPSTVG